MDDAAGSATRRRLLVGGGALATTALLSACGASSAAPSSTPGAAGSGGTAAGSGRSDWLYLVVLTGKMIGKPGFPQVLPADFTVPAHTTIQCEIRCLDDGAATTPSGYEKVKGTVGGTITIVPLVDHLPSGKGQVVRALDPKKVAHTITMADTGLNIPIPPLASVQFRFNSGAAGTHGWQCMAACGTGTGGWGGPMSTDGWMKGTMTVR